MVQRPASSVYRLSSTVHHASSSVYRLSSTIAVLLLLLSACSFPADAPTVTPVSAVTPSAEAVTATRIVPTENQAAQDSSTPSSVPPTATPEPLRLTLWTTENATGLELLQTLATEYADGQGIVIEVVPKSPAALRVDLIASDLAEEPLPELIWGDQDDLAGLLADGQLQPVELAQAAEEFVPAVLTSATRDAQIWGQPVVAQDYLLLLYNRAFIQQPPATTDELLLQAREVSVPGASGIVAGWNEALWMLAWLNGYGGAPTTPDGLRPTLNTPPMIEAMNLLLELRSAAPPAQISYTDADLVFQAGQAAFAIDGDWSLPYYRDAALGLDIGVAPLPRIPATDRLAAPPLGASYVMFHALLSPEKQAAAHGFADFLSQPETQVRVALALKRLPVLRSELQNPQITANPDLAVGIVQADAATGLPPTRALTCALRAIDLHLPALLDNQANQEQTAQFMQQSADECVIQE